MGQRRQTEQRGQTETETEIEMEIKQRMGQETEIKTEQ